MDNNRRITVFVFLFALIFFSRSHAQESPAIGTKFPTFALRSNLLLDASSSLNLGADFRLNDDLSLKLPVTYNPWQYGDNKRFKFILFQPELRWWLCEPFTGHFFGLHAHYAYYNVGGIDMLNLQWLKNFRHQGYLVGGGLSYGYQFYLAPRWGLELYVGVGYAYLNYDKYYCESCGEWINREDYHYFGPTQVGMSLIYIIK